MNNRFSHTMLIAALLLLVPALLLAGANETPGAYGRPHKFGCFMANTHEFGLTDLEIFKKYVVKDQHYSFGARYEDPDLDNSFDGGGVMNFLNFCYNAKHDVMLVVAHGGPLPSTLVEMYKYDAAGLAARDAAYTTYSGTLAAGTIRKVNYTNWAYTIEVTQLFYNYYLLTPQAMGWWSTCYSSKLSMTGPAELRCYLGYDNAVYSSKCYCDEKKILRRMDGQEGQQLRPLKVAAAGINGICPPGGANLVIQGKQNTVLSPSVLQHAPTQPVCSATPGFIKFDTTMDTTVDPKLAIKVYGDGTLSNQAWEADDKLSFVVTPTGLPALILYSGEEQWCRSKADHARLDGNTNPRVNAKGPNRDDYIWFTYCAAVAPSRPSTPSPPARPSTPTTPGGSGRVSTPISNSSGAPATVTVTLTDQRGWCTQPPEILTMDTDEVQMVTWDFEIPQEALPGDVDLYTVTVASDGWEPPFEAYGEVVVDPLLHARLIGNRYLRPGHLNDLELQLENMSDQAVSLVNLMVEGEPGWTVFPPTITSHQFAEGEALLCSLMVDVPPGLPQGEPFELQVRGEVNGLISDISTTYVSVGLPVRVAVTEVLDLVPAKADALIEVEIRSYDPTPLNVEYFVEDSNGLPVFFTSNPSLPPFAMEIGQAHLAVPEDPTLVGVQGEVLLTVHDLDSDLEMVTRLPYVIEDPIEISGTTGPLAPVYTGGPPDMPFLWEFTLRNRCDIELAGELSLISPLASALSTPFMLPPGGMEPVPTELIIPEDHPAGLEPVQLELMTMQMVGDRLLDLELRINTPVTVNLIRRGWAGESGELVTMQAELRNHRADLPMVADFEWSDERGWLVSDPMGSRLLAPLAADTVTADLQLPIFAQAFADSDSVTINVSMIYDSGQPAFTTGGTWLMLIDPTVGVEESSPAAPTELSANYPNPFNPTTRIRFNLAEAGPVTLMVHDVVGRQVAVICREELQEGIHERSWNALHDRGGEAASGVYFIRLETEQGVWTRKAVLIR